MITIDYSNKNILYSGRFIDKCTGIQSAFQGNLVRFMVSGTKQVKIVADVKGIADGGAVCLAVNIDNYLETTPINFIQSNEVFEGERAVTINLPDTNQHDIVFKMSAGMPINQYNGLSYIKLKSILLDDGGVISPYPVGKYKILCIGDSWMSAWHDWVRLLDTTKYDVYPVAYGGAKSSDILNAYSYQIATTPKQFDGIFNCVLISIGINDYVQGVLPATFKSNISALISKIRNDHPDTKIIILNVPRNIANGKDFDQYGTVLQELVSEFDKMQYISTEPIWNDLVWLSDNYHLSPNSKQDYANFVDSQINHQTGNKKVKVYNDGKIITIPVFKLQDVENNALRIYLNGEIMCFKLVEENDLNATNIKIKTPCGVKAISTQ